jgi:hypothetical protein
MAGPVEAQVLAVRVVTEEGTPIAAATVDFWQKTRRVQSRTTRPDGITTIMRGDVRGLTSVSARAIGFRMASVRPTKKDKVEVRLARTVPQLPEIVVQALPRYSCRKDERAARDVWRTATGVYALLPPARGYWASGRGTNETITLSRPTSSESWGTARWVVSGQARARSIRFVRDSGYAVRRKPGKSGGFVGSDSTGPWWYPNLHTWNSDHFARPEFGAFNALYTISSGPTGWTLGFCSRHTKRPGIIGRLRIDSTYAFVRAEWQFLTGKPDEDAGGEIIFLAGTKSALLPMVSYFWKRLDDFDGEEPLYHRETFLGDQWTINLDGPPRNTDDEGFPH